MRSPFELLAFRRLYEAMSIICSDEGSCGMHRLLGHGRSKLYTHEASPKRKPVFRAEHFQGFEGLGPLRVFALINGDPELRPRSSKPKQGPSVYNFCLGGILCISGPVVTWLRVADPVSSFSEESRGAQGP